MLSDKTLRSKLIENGLMSEIQSKIVSDYQKSVGGSIDEVVVKLGFLTEEELDRFLAEKKSSVVSKEVVAQDLMEKVPRKLLQGYKIVPITSENGPVLAAENELEPIVLEELHDLFGKQLSVVQVEPGSVQELLNSLFEGEDGDRDHALISKVTAEKLCCILLAKGVISEEDIREPGFSRKS